MKTERFNEILNSRLEKIRATLERKATEYVQNDDRLYNFRRAARISDKHPAEALWGMAMKHLVSVIDLVEGSPETIPDDDFIDEKIGDLINYLILLEAILKE